MQIKETLAGRKVRCPGCGDVLRVPDSSDEPVDETATDHFTESPPEPATHQEAPPRERDREDEEMARAPYRPSKRPRRYEEEPRRSPRIAFEEGWFGSMNSGIVGGLLMMLIAVVWFFVGLAFGYLFWYPPILFVIGVIALCKGVMGRGN
jgi:hypothetical protein